MLPECEQLRCDKLEVVTSVGVSYSYYEAKKAPTNPLMKSHNGLQDNDSGALRGYVPHEGSNKNLLYEK